MYLIWFVIYFSIVWLVLGANRKAFLFTALIYGVSIGIALSPVGEWILRILESTRLPRTNEEKEYLLPIFQEVYQNALEKNPKLPKDIKIYIIDANFVNAFAMGRKTIAVTIGAMKTFSPEQLKGVIAHEFGHITYGHTKALLLSVVGNAIFSVIVIIARVFYWACEFLTGIFYGTSIFIAVINILSFLTRIILDVVVMAFMYAGQIVLSLNSRINEFMADNFAYQMGLSEELISALYFLQKLGTQKMTMKQRMTASHPHIAERIERLEGRTETEAIV